MRPGCLRSAWRRVVAMTDRPDFSTVREILGANGLDVAVFVPGANLYRLFSRRFPLSERPMLVIVPKEGEPLAIVPELELSALEKTGFEGHTLPWRDQEGFEGAFRLLSEARPDFAAAKIGIEGQQMRVFEQMAMAAVYPEAVFFDAHEELSGLRLIKTDMEIANLRAAIRVSEQALEATLGEVAIGMTETEVQSILLRALFDFGADGLAFAPIVAAGDNAAHPHAIARSDYRIKSGDALLFDFGASYNGMNADITRTVFVGSASAYDRAFYECVQQANAAGKAAILPGQTAHGVDDVVQTVLESSEFAPFRRHKTGHGLGYAVHEAPQIMRGNETPLEQGMVFTVEPGLYRPGECGVRIEDDVLVTAEGHECLTSFPRELQVVG